MEKSLRVGVIGAGMMGQNHARVYSNLTNAELVGVCDLNQEAGKLVAKRTNSNYYSDI